MTYRLLRQLVLIVAILLLSTIGVIFLFSSDISLSEWTILLYDIVIRTIGVIILYAALLMARALFNKK